MRRLCYALLLSLPLAAGCPPPDSGKGGAGEGPAPASQDAFDQIKARGRFVVAVDPTYPPFVTLDAGKAMVGFDVDLVREMAQDMGVEAEFKSVEWDGIIGLLLNKKVDAILSGMSITDERKKAVDFSDPYYSIGQVILKKKGDTRFANHEELNAPEFTVTTQLGTTGEKAVRDLMPNAKLRLFPKADEACLNVVQGKADAVVFDHPFLQEYLSKQPDQLEGLWQPFTQEPIGAAIRKDSPKLRDQLNATLKRLRESGRMAELEGKHFPAPPK